jgi:hypothetical protein
MKYTVLTYLIGDYDLLREIAFDTTNSEVEYLLITDRKDLISKTWKVIYDPDIDKPELAPFDRVFMVRYNLFKYASNDICVRLDHSFKVIKPLDKLVKKFIKGNYDGCLCVHGYRYDILEEYNVWMNHRNFSHTECLRHIRYLNQDLQYDFGIKGLYEQTFSINRRNEMTKDIDENVFKLLLKCGGGEHVTRLDQTISSAYINKYHGDKNFMYVSIYSLTKDLLEIYDHADTKPRRIIAPYRWRVVWFNNQEIDIKDLEI